MVQAQAEGGTYLTGSVQCIEGSRTVQEDDAVEFHLIHFPKCTAAMSDPRLSGTGVHGMQQFCLKEEADHVCMGRGTLELTGPDGTWVGNLGWVEAPDRTKLPGWGVLEGTEAYEGWTFWFHHPDLLDLSAVTSGILYEGPPPPWGDSLPLFPGEAITDPIEAVVARQDAVAGYMVVPVLRLVSAAEVGPDVLTDLREVKGRKAAVDIPAGTPITPDLLEPAE